MFGKPYLFHSCCTSLLNGAGVCVNSTYARSNAAYEKATGGEALPSGEFSEIWKTWNSPAEEKELGVRTDLIMYGSPAAIDWAGIGTAYSERDVWAGKMKPGNPVTYQGRPGHSFIFLGYRYDKYGSITGMNTWNQWNTKKYPMEKIEKSWGYDLRGANFKK